MPQCHPSESLEGFLTARPPDRQKTFEALLSDLRELTAAGRTERVVATLRGLQGPYLDYTSATALVRILRPLSRSGDLPGRKVRLAVLGGFTTTQLTDLIELQLVMAGLCPEIYEADYGLLRQEVLDTQSGLFSFQPDLVYLATTWRDVGHRPALENTGGVDELVRQEVDEWEDLWLGIRERLGAHVLQDNFVAPPWTALSNHERARPSSLTSFLQRTNEALQRRAPGFVTIHDVERLASSAGRWAWSDERFYHQAKLPCSPEHLVHYAHSLASVVAAQMGLSRKCLVLDLDNTLWGGVVGDDGMDRLRLGQGDAESEAFQDFQRYVDGLRRRGVILAVCSANEDSIAREAFARHPSMVLKLDDIACFVANWNDKASNLRRIANELEIGLDAMVFVDDDPTQRALVRAMLPEVAVPEVSGDPVDHVRTLEEHRYFEVVSLAREDLDRTSLYRANGERRRSQQAASDLDEFLAGLNMRAKIDPLRTVNVERCAQLINKTNQFNLTLRRHPLSRIQALMDDPKWVGWAVSHRDRFGDNGLISVMLARVEGDTLDIDVWVMSCRVLRRGVEHFLMNHVHERALQMGVARIRGTHVPGPKNALVAELFSELGFAPVDKTGDEGATHWDLLVDDGWSPLPTHVTAEDLVHG